MMSTSLVSFKSVRAGLMNLCIPSDVGLHWKVAGGVRVYRAFELEVYLIYLFLLENREVEYDISGHCSPSYAGLVRDNHSNGLHRMRHLNYEAIAQRSDLQGIIR